MPLKLQTVQHSITDIDVCGVIPGGVGGVTPNGISGVTPGGVSDVSKSGTCSVQVYSSN